MAQERVLGKNSIPRSWSGESGTTAPHLLQRGVARVVVVLVGVVGALVDGHDEHPAAAVGGISGRGVQKVTVEEESVAGLHLHVL